MRSTGSLRRAIGALTASSVALLAAGCEGAMGPEEDVRFTISIVVTSPGAAAMGAGAGVSASGLFQDDGVHSLVLNRVAVVVREVELERISDDDCDDLSGEDHDTCEAFEVGPILLELPLDGSVAQILTSDVPPDVYDEIEFDVHTPEDDGTEDLQFLLQHPEFKDVSVRVEGACDDEVFVFLQDLNEERELDLVPPLVVEGGFGTVNLTLELDVGSWFHADEHSLLDPRTANKGGFYEKLVEENIRASIRAFADSDGDGREG